jgi:MerR family redox-sensitive transcriptional activator SoxR
MTIGEVAKATGIAQSAIRYYESIGILPAPRRRAGIRSYDPEVIDSIRVMRFARAAGISIRSLKAIAGAERRTTRKEAWHDAMRARITDLDAVILEAERAKERLESLIDCHCQGDKRRCVIFQDH